MSRRAWALPCVFNGLVSNAYQVNTLLSLSVFTMPFETWMVNEHPRSWFIVVQYSTAVSRLSCMPSSVEHDWVNDILGHSTWFLSWSTQALELQQTCDAVPQTHQQLYKNSELSYLYSSILFQKILLNQFIILKYDI